MTPERLARIKQVLNQRQKDITLILDEVHKGRNLSAIIRSADAHGIDHIHCVTPEAGFQHYRGTALGSDKWVEVIKHGQVETPIKQLKQAGYQIIGTHLDHTATSYLSIDYTQPTAIVVGRENHGLSPLSLSLVDHFITIPMKGMVESFNVSVACAIVLAEAQKQRERSGAYEQRQLSEACYKKRLFQWCHPQLRQFCDEKGYEYPEVDEQGELLAGPDWYRKVR